jgi:hypothetical protein
MKLSDIQERVNQRPFRPFAVETVGGTWILVDSESNIMMSDRRPGLMVIFDSGGHLWILDVNDVSALESK